MVEPNFTPRQIATFRGCFSGLRYVYGSYDPNTGRVWQVKAPVTDGVLCSHLTGRRPYGVYLLDGDRTRAAAADFDDGEFESPLAFLRVAARLGLHAYLERSKRKGFHAWMFFLEAGVVAAKARRVLRQILVEIGCPTVEVFPKQDRLNGQSNFGNFINAPLFGRLTPDGRTVFVDHRDPRRPHPDQWTFLESIQRNTESMLDEIISVNADPETTPVERGRPTTAPSDACSYPLPPCARRMLIEGVTSNQRVACFRLAVQLKRVGLPQDVSVGALLAWSVKNRPADGKRQITAAEVEAQTRWAYSAPYRSCGCEDPAVTPYCDAECRIRSPSSVAPTHSLR